MAFANYTDLKSAVRSWLNRENQEVIDRIPDFIFLAEERIFRQLRSRFNEVYLEYDSGALDNASGIELPADFAEAKLCKWDGRRLTRKSDQWFYGRDPQTAQSTPVYFARTKPNEIQFWAPPDNNADVELWYYNKQDHISDSVVPSLYLEAAGLYLFGALAEAKPFLKATDQATIATWEAKFNEVLESLQDESDEAEYAGSTVEVSSVYNDSEIRGTAAGSIF